MTATGAPLRVTSTTSPDATRLSTSEKLRAASVAVMRVTRGRLSDKSECSAGSCTYGLIKAAVNDDPYKAMGLDGALSKLSQRSCGPATAGVWTRIFPHRG